MCRIRTKALHVVSVLLSLPYIANVAHGGPTGQYLKVSPTNVTVSEGQSARLTCSVGNRAGTCQWTRDGFALGTERSLPEFARYRLDGASDDVCDLLIDPVVPLDEGQYQCQVSGQRGVASISSPSVKLSVNCEPGKPYIVQAKEGDKVEVEAGEEVELHCQSQGGRPPAEVQWWDGEGNRLVSDLQEFATKMEDKKTWLTVSILKLNPVKPMLVKCTVFNDAFPEPKESEPIQIIFKGQVAAEIRKFTENETFELNCEEGLKPEDKKYKWIINGNEVAGETENSLKIVRINDSYDNSNIRCTSEDRNGEKEVLRIFRLVYTLSKTVVIKQNMPVVSEVQTYHKKKKNKKKLKTVQNDQKRKTVFTCVAEEEMKSEPKYVWIKGKLEKTVTAETESNQKFKCNVVNGGYDKIKQMAHNMKGMSRKIKRFTKTLNHITNLIEET